MCSNLDLLPASGHRSELIPISLGSSNSQVYVHQIKTFESTCIFNNVPFLEAVLCTTSSTKIARSPGSGYASQPRRV
jgi:hypothetical protein